MEEVIKSVEDITSWLQEKGFPPDVVKGTLMQFSL